MRTLISIVAFMLAIASPAWSAKTDLQSGDPEQKRAEKEDKKRQMDKNMDHATMKPESMQRRDRIHMYQEDMQKLMAQMQATDDPERRRQLMRQHSGIIRDQVRMIRQQQDKGKKDMSMSMENRMVMMEEHMAMMEMMMDHMMQREQMMDKDK